MQKWTKTLVASSLLVSSLPLHIKDVKAEEKSGTKLNGSFESSPAYMLDPEEKVGETINTPFMESEKKGEGDYRLTIYNDEQFLKRDGSWKDVDLRLAETQGRTIEPKNSNIDVRFDDRISPRVPFMSVEGSDGDAIDFRFEGTQTKEGIQKIEERTADTNDNQIIYKDVHPGVDVRHVVMNEEVKEDIILNQKNMDIEKFIYRIHTKLDVGLDGAGNILFKDPRDGEVKYTMPAPIMSDSSFDAHSGLSRESRDIRYELVKGEDGFTLELIPSKEWLSDEDTKYPVYIDPTLSRGAAQDAFVTSADPKGNYNKFWSSAQGEYVLRVGKYDGQTGTNYAFMKMDGLSDIKGATITSASLKTYVKWSYHPTTKTGIWLDRVNSKWSESSINWENKPTSTNITSTKVARAQWATFNVKDTIQQIADGEMDDYGFKLHANGNDENYWKQLTASESGKKSNVVISYSYPQMKGLKAEPFPTAAGASTGYINLSWGKAKEATNYRLQLFNGKGWRTIYKGAATSFSTKNKKLWPTTNQYKDKDSLTGGIAFREGDGMELPLDPSPMYRASNNSNTNTKAYQFRVVADYELGSSEPSTTAKPVLDGIIPENPETPQLEEIHSNQKDGKGWFELEWDEVEGATSYDLLIYNGEKYERIPVGNETIWSSRGKRVFPTEAQQLSYESGNLFRTARDGTDFLTDPRTLYSLVGPKHSSTTNYFVKIIAKSEKGESLPSNALKIWFPTKVPIPYGKGYRYEGNENIGYLNAAWSSIDEAKGYVVSLHNGERKQIVARLDKDDTFWSSRFQGLWPRNITNKSFDLDKLGYELLSSPEKIYELTENSTLDNSLYYVTIQSFREEDTKKEWMDSSRYLGISDPENEEGTTSIEIIEKENGKIETNTSYEKMSAPEVEFVTKDDTYNEEMDGQFEDTDTSVTLTSDIHVLWEPVDGALKYQVMFFNGHDYSYFDVPGNQTSWSSENKNIFPTNEQLMNKELSFRTNGDGKPLPRSPRALYERVNDVWNTKQNVNVGYQISVIAVQRDGASVPSDVTFAKIPLEEPQVWVEDEIVNDDNTQSIELKWNRAEDTTSEIIISNGKSNETYDVGTATTWKSGTLRIPVDSTIIIRSKNTEGEFSETVVELDHDESTLEEDETQNNRTIADDFYVSADDDAWTVGKPKEVATKQVRAVKAIIQIIKSSSKKGNNSIKVKIKKKSNKKVSKTIKPSKANYKNKKPANDAAKDYMSGKSKITIRDGYTTRPMILTSERLGHILLRHDIRYWDGSLGPGNRQTFFPNQTSTQEILRLITKNVRENHIDINRNLFDKVKGFRQFTKFIDGNFYRIGIQFNGTKNPEIKQFYPVNQFWRFK